MLGDELASLAYDFGSLHSGIEAGVVNIPKLGAKAGDVAAQLANQTASKIGDVVHDVANVTVEIVAIRRGSTKIEKTTEYIPKPHKIRSSEEIEPAISQIF